MKVVFIHTDFRIYWPARLNALNNYLKVRGIDLKVIEICGEGSPYSFVESCNDHPSYWDCLFPKDKMESLSTFVANRHIKNKLNDIQPEVIFCGPIAFPSGAAAISWTNKNKKKCIVFDDSRLEDVPRRWYVNYIKCKVYMGADAILCPSTSWNRTFNYFKFSDSQIFHGLNVVDNSFWASSINYRNVFKEKYFLTVGRQVTKKNFMFLLNAYKKYYDLSSKPMHLIFVGDGPERKFLEQKTLAEDLNKFIHFIPFSSQDELKCLYKYANWFILPSRYGETWGLVVNEAMASGLPVIVSNQVGCASTLVEEGINGYIFDPDHVENLVNILFKASSLNEEDRLIMGRNSIKIISNWDLTKFCNGVYESIKFVANKKKRTPDLLGRIISEIWKGRYRQA